MKGVRGAASFALGQFAEHLQPEISEHYERVLPCIFTVLSDAVPDVQVSLVLMWSYVNVLNLPMRFSELITKSFVNNTLHIAIDNLVPLAQLDLICLASLEISSFDLRLCWTQNN